MSRTDTILDFAEISGAQFAESGVSLLAAVGGKAANLGELSRAGLPVPPGFCLTTEAYQRATQPAGMSAIFDALEANDSARLLQGEDTLAPSLDLVGKI